MALPNGPGRARQHRPAHGQVVNSPSSTFSCTCNRSVRKRCNCQLHSAVLGAILSRPWNLLDDMLSWMPCLRNKCYSRLTNIISLPGGMFSELAQPTWITLHTIALCTPNGANCATVEQKTAHRQRGVNCTSRARFVLRIGRKGCPTHAKSRKGKEPRTARRVFAIEHGIKVNHFILLRTQYHGFVSFPFVLGLNGTVAFRKCIFQNQ